MDGDDAQSLYEEDARLLGLVGSVLARTDLPLVTVRIPATLARAAIAAWRREDEGELGPESCEERVQRHRAGTLALIGLALEQRGRPDGDAVAVDLGPELIGLALDAADELSR